MLNPHLYVVLRKHFGEVKVTNEGVKRVEDRVPGEYPVVVERGEHYSVCCPYCEDERFRLSFSYQYLCRRPMSRERVTHLVNCYNEQCEEIKTREFREPLLEDLEAAELGLLEEVADVEATRPERRVRGPIRLPNGVRPLTELRRNHPANRFLLENYKAFGELGRDRIIPYLSSMYGVGYTDEYDDEFPASCHRVIFPIRQGSQTVAWQGRAIRKGDLPRWYLPPGFAKTFYNGDNVSPDKVPVVSEGVMNAICCGPCGIGIFGKSMNRLQADEFAKRWKRAILATDADTFVPDNRKGGGGRIYARELRDLLEGAGVSVRSIRWPDDVLELATRKCNGEDVSVPDAADLGFRRMHALLQEVGG